MVVNPRAAVTRPARWAGRVVRYAPDSEWLYKLGFAAMRAWRQRLDVMADEPRHWRAGGGLEQTLKRRVHGLVELFERASTAS